MCKFYKECDKYRPVCMLYGSFNGNKKPKVKKVVTCENYGCAECKKED